MQKVCNIKNSYPSGQRLFGYELFYAECNENVKQYSIIAARRMIKSRIVRQYSGPVGNIDVHKKIKWY